MRLLGLGLLFAALSARADDASLAFVAWLPADSLWSVIAAILLTLIAALLTYTYRLRNKIAKLAGQHRATEETARRLAGALDQTAEMVMITDVRGRIEYVNPAFTRITGYSAEEVRGRTPAILRSGKHSADFYERLWTTIHRGRVFEGDFVNRRKDGTLFYGRTSIAPLHDPVANCPYFVAIGYDLTQRRLAEEEARRHDEQLAHTARLNIIGEMVASLAHELSQPLTAIINYAHGCVRRALVPDAKAMQLMEPLKQIVVQGQRTAAVVQHLREFVMKREPQRESSDINHLVAQAASLAAGEANRRGVSVALELAPNLPHVYVDGIQIEQVVLNLVRNGAEALANTDVPTRELRLRTSLTDRHEIETSISDTGPGLSPDLSAKLFEPFFSTKPNGVGLGLAISRNIVESHGGRLWVTPNTDRGVTFHFTVPIEMHSHGTGDRIRSR
jgi:PAS domain S-box-containing protein